MQAKQENIIRKIDFNIYLYWYYLSKGVLPFCQSKGFGMGFVYNLVTTLKSLTTLRTLTNNNNNYEYNEQQNRKPTEVRY